MLNRILLIGFVSILRSVPQKFSNRVERYSNLFLSPTRCSFRCETTLRSNLNWSLDDDTGEIRVKCESPDDIELLGSKFAEISGNGDVILMRGDLGAGKTTFSRGLIRKKFDDEEMRVTSPSYLLDNTYEYDTDKTIHHMDLYRLPTGCDLSILGIPDVFKTSLCIIEWPQRMQDNLPSDYVDVEISIADQEIRYFSFTPHGRVWLEKLKIWFRSNA